MAQTSVSLDGGIPSLMPPVGITGPIIVGLRESSWPAKSTQVIAIQYGLPASRLIIVVLPSIGRSSKSGDKPTTSDIATADA